MQGKLVRKDIRKCREIYRHSDYYIFCGDKFQSCYQQSGPLITYHEIKMCLHGMVMLPHNRLLVDDAVGVLHLIDLEAGKVLKSKQLTQKRMCETRFALSENGDTAFRIWYWRKKWYLAKIDLHSLNYNIYDYPASMYGVRDIVVNSPNELLVLEVQNVAVDGKAVTQNQITSAALENDICTTTTIHRWDDSGCGMFFDGRFVWESDYKIHDIYTGDTFSLVENSDIPLSHNHVTRSHIYYPEYGYLQLVNGSENIFIDCDSRKIIAQYSSNPKEHIYRGIYTGHEFLIGRPGGIYALAFPYFASENEAGQ